MDIRIGFIHNRKEFNLELCGKFKIVDNEGNELETVGSFNKIFNVSLMSSIPAQYKWYEKKEIFYDISKMESIRTKYNYNNDIVRVIKTGKQITEKIDNFEYWVLAMVNKPDFDIHPSGDYKFKKIVTKKSLGKLKFEDHIVKNKITFIPLNKESYFKINDVKIGIQFHWEHSENLEYQGGLEILIDNAGLLTAVNVIDLEDYLASVNSSEMRNDNNIEMLKAQTIAARGTVLATMGKHHYDEGFDLCGDDHCQCYQGSSRISELSRQVTAMTTSEVLFFNSKICDTRYAKICGGITEKYSSCWEDMELPYILPLTDDSNSKLVDDKLNNEATVKEFIDNDDLDCFCNTKKYKLPKSLEFCNDGFRWEEFVPVQKINKAIKEKTIYTNYGNIKDFEVLLRGYSGRIVELLVKAEKGNFILKKELAIRKFLSDSYLKSSCFCFNKVEKDNELIGFKLVGAGWGHGVGMCQVGAQIMGEKGYSYKEILHHYYRGTVLKKMKI